MRAYVSTIRYQPALGWKLASCAAFSAAFIRDHPVAEFLILVGIVGGIAFPLDYLLWRYRKSP